MRIVRAMFVCAAAMCAALELAASTSLGVYASGPFATNASGRVYVGPVMPKPGARVESGNLAFFAALHDMMCERVDVPSTNFVFSGAESKTNMVLPGCAAPGARRAFEMDVDDAFPLAERAAMQGVFDQLRTWLRSNSSPFDAGGVTVYPLCSSEGLALPVGGRSGWTIFKENDTSYPDRRAFNYGSPRCSPALGRVDETGMFYGGEKPPATGWTNTIISAWMRAVESAGFNSVEADEHPSCFTVPPGDTNSADSTGMYLGGDSFGSKNYYSHDFSPALTNIIASAPARAANFILSKFDCSPWSLPRPAALYVIQHTETTETADVDVNATSNAIASTAIATGAFDQPLIFFGATNSTTETTYTTNAAPSTGISLYETTPGYSMILQIEKYYAVEWEDEVPTSWEHYKTRIFYDGDGRPEMKYEIYRAYMDATAKRRVVRTDVFPFIVPSGSWSRTLIEDSVVEVIPLFDAGWPTSSAGYYVDSALIWRLGTSSYEWWGANGSGSVTGGEIDSMDFMGSPGRQDLLDMIAAWANHNPTAPSNPRPNPLEPTRPAGSVPQIIEPTMRYSGWLYRVEKYVYDYNMGDWEYKGADDDDHLREWEDMSESTFGEYYNPNPSWPQVSDGASVDFPEYETRSVSLNSAASASQISWGWSSQNSAPSILGAQRWHFMKFTDD